METSLLHFPDWQILALNAGQSFLLYLMILLGLKLAGRRLFGARGQQDLLVIVLIADAAAGGMEVEGGGFWGAVASIGTLLLVGTLVAQVPYLRRLLGEKSFVLFENGVVDRKVMSRHGYSIKDLEHVAREYGKDDFHVFSKIVAEADGALTGILKEDEASIDKASPTGQRGLG